MKNRPLTVGNRVTYEWNEKIYQEIMVSNNDIDIFKKKCKKLGYKILNVEACLWEKIDFEKEIKEKKLFTEDEEEFLKSMIKWYNISTIEFTKATRNREKSADEMFEELGYEVKYQIYKDDVVIIGYTKENTIAEECPIMFLKKAKRVMVNNWIDMQELKAINKKCEELKWK